MSVLPSFHDWLEEHRRGLEALLDRAGLAVEPRAITSSGHGLVEAAAGAGLAGACTWPPAGWPG